MNAGDSLLPLVYLSALLLVWVPYALRRRQRAARNLEVLDESRGAGLMEPASLHPVIDANACIGCATCVVACPEQNVLGLVDAKAELITPANCIGHGACKDACPMDAIELVLGTATRGVDIPVVDGAFQTNVQGIFVAGELGGMGLIRNAIEQGRQAIRSVRDFPGVGEGPDLDVMIVGAGPAGFSASLAAMEHGLRAVTLEQETLGGTVAHYPRGKIVMTAPVHLPRYGKVRLHETTKEALLELWREVEKKTRVKIRYEERVEGISRSNGVFEVRSTRAAYRARTIVLAIGRRGTPRKLGIAGEDHEKVVYRLIDPEQYRGRKVLVVGGGDSALEAAAALCEQPGIEVALAYRSDAFSRAKPANRAKIEAAEAAGGLRVLLRSQPTAISTGHVELRHGDDSLRIENDALIVCAGGILPTGFLESIGVEVETKRGTV